MSAPRLCGLLAEALPRPLHLRLHGRRPERLAVLARAARARAAGTEVSAASSLAQALEGADAVILLVRVGGFAARRHDEVFPRAVGLVGDEGLGPGGLANGWRTVPFVSALAKALRTHCPGAFVANLMAPLGMTTATLHEAGLDVLGLCELPAVTRAALGHGPGEGAYGGLNHLGWFWDLPRAPGVHPLKYEGKVFGTEAGSPGAGVPRPAATGVRADALAELDARLAATFAEAPERIPLAEAERATPWFEHALVPVLAARFGGPAYHGFGNLPNAGHLVEAPPEQIVEVELRLEGRRLEVRAPGPLPRQVQALFARAALAERLGLRAARARDTRLLGEAMSALPFTLSDAALATLVAEAVRPVTDRALEVPPALGAP